MDQYRLFKQWVPLQKLSLGSLIDKTWKYYDYGPKNVTPLIFIPGTSGTAEIFYKQIVSLCPKGFRIISIQYAPYDSYLSWCKGFDRFMEKMGFENAHIFGTALGGYLAQCYLQYRPNRVASLILNNSFCDTQYFHDNAPCAGMFTIMPEFMLKKLVLSNFPTGMVDPEIAEGIDFMVEQLESLSQAELSSRLILNCTLNSLNQTFGLSYEKITIIDSMDSHTIPENMREEVYKYYPLAKVALLKTGGDICYLSKSDELNMHIQVHLRQQGFDPVNIEASEEEIISAQVATKKASPQQDSLFIEEEDEGAISEDKVFSKLNFSPSAYVSSQPTATFNNNNSTNNSNSSNSNNSSTNSRNQTLYQDSTITSNPSSSAVVDDHSIDSITTSISNATISSPHSSVATTTSKKPLLTDDVIDHSLFENSRTNYSSDNNNNSASNPFEEDIFSNQATISDAPKPEIKESIFEDSFGH